MNYQNVKLIIVLVLLVMVTSSLAYGQKEIKNGVYKEYYDDGTVKSQVEYVNGKKEGVEKIFKGPTHPGKGKLGILRHYKNGILHGEEISYSSNGDVSQIIKHENGRGIAYGYSYARATLDSYSTSGYIMDVTEMVNGVMEGLGTRYYRSGAIRAEGKWRNNEREGVWKRYYEDGKLEEYAEFEAGELIGSVKVYNKDGSLKEERGCWWCMELQ